MKNELYILSYTVNHEFPRVKYAKNINELNTIIEALQGEARRNQECFDCTITHIINGEIQ